RLLREHRAAELYLQARRVCVLGNGAHIRREVERDIVRLHVEEDLGVRDLAALRDEAVARRVVRRRHADDARLLAQLREDRLDLVIFQALATAPAYSPRSTTTESRRSAELSGESNRPIANASCST